MGDWMSIPVYKLRDAFSHVVSSSSTKFVESVDVVFALGVDPRKSDGQIRGIVALPHGIGREIKVAAFSSALSMESSEKFGADIVGGADLVEVVKSGKVPKVDWCVTTPEFMPMLSKAAKVLGPKGLMPNIKFGSVASDLGSIITKIKNGQIKFKTDKAGIVHAKIGNISFSVDQLEENYNALLEAIKVLKPASFGGGVYIKKSYVNTTMGLSCRVAI